jgi:preprotein translocase subunit SecG
VPEVEVVVIVIHVLVSLVLIALILLHAGRGGGVSEMFGGGMQSQAMGSTVMEKNLDRITIVTAIIFTGTTILLAFMLQD